MRSKIIFFTAAAVLIGVLSVMTVADIFKKPKSNTIQSQKIVLVTSFYPLYYFTLEIGKENIDVINLTPAGTEPHDFEPNTQDISKIEKSNLLILNGGGLEPYGEKIKNDLQGSSIKVIEASLGLTSRMDPHVWLDPVLAKSEVEIITQALIEVDSVHKSAYETNSQNLLSRLDFLDSAFEKELSLCKQKDIVSSHASLGYLAARYGFNQISLTGLSPHQEPSPQALANISKELKKNKIKYIFFETLVSPRLAETIAEEVGAKTLVFNPLEGLTREEEAAGKDYFSIQTDNLKNLKIALECQAQ